VERLFRSVKLQVESVSLDAAYTFGARVAGTLVVMDCGRVREAIHADISSVLTLRVALVFMLVLVLLLATVTLGVMRLGLARTTTVLALLDRTTLGVDVVQLAICEEYDLASRSSKMMRTRREGASVDTYHGVCIRSHGDP
jgi:hypothetical protein